MQQHQAPFSTSIDRRLNMKKTSDHSTFATTDTDDLPWELRDREPKPMFLLLKSENPKSLAKLAEFINQNAKTFVDQPIKPAVTNSACDIFTAVFTSRWRPEKIASYLTGNFAGYTELKPLSSPFNGYTDTLLILPIAESPGAVASSTLTSWLRYHCSPHYK